MLDLRAIREDPDRFRAGLARRDAATRVDEVLRLDEERRSLTTRVEELRAEQNRASKAIGAAAPEERPALIAEAKKISDELEEEDPRLERVSAELDALMAELPNLPDPDVPEGLSDDDNVEIKKVGEPPSFDFPVRDHVELGELHGTIDIDRAVRTSGSRFAYLMGPLVLVQWALVRYALDFLITKGFTPVVPPVLVREQALFGTGFLPEGAEMIYATRDEAVQAVGLEP